MKAPEWNDQLFLQHRDSIVAEDARRAFEYLTDAATSNPLYSVENSGRRPQKQSLHYNEIGTGERPFAYIVNNAHILFYVRLAGQARFPGGPSAFRKRFTSVRENKTGEWTIRIETLDDAIQLQTMVFGTTSTSGIPTGITKEDVLRAIADIDAGNVKDRFGDSRLWDVLDHGRLYPPKRVLGVAARRLAGRVLTPGDFSGGEDSKCHEILEELGFKIVPKGDAKEIDSVEEARIEAYIRARKDIPATTCEQLIDARRGQGRFRRDVAAVEKKGCRMTSVTQVSHLRASHIKPWGDSDDREKLDPYNGLLLSPHIDHLFDRGYISFSDAGELMVSKRLKQSILAAWGVALPMNVGAFEPKQCEYLGYHRRKVFQK
jgi:hypothetical protein